MVDAGADVVDELRDDIVHAETMLKQAVEGTAPAPKEQAADVTTEAAPSEESAISPEQRAAAEAERTSLPLSVIPSCDCIQCCFQFRSFRCVCTAPCAGSCEPSHQHVCVSRRACSGPCAGRCQGHL